MTAADEIRAALGSSGAVRLAVEGIVMNIDELRAIVDRMTPGTWVSTRSDLSPIRVKGEVYQAVIEARAGMLVDAPWVEISPDDAAGIVALRNAAPALLDEIERLREALKFYAGWGVLNPQYDDQVQNDGGDKARAALGEQP